jgi:hypothetical protein
VAIAARTDRESRITITAGNRAKITITSGSIFTCKSALRNGNTTPRKNLDLGSLTGAKKADHAEERAAMAGRLSMPKRQ